MSKRNDREALEAELQNTVNLDVWPVKVPSARDYGRKHNSQFQIVWHQPVRSDRIKEAGDFSKSACGHVRLEHAELPTLDELLSLPNKLCAKCAGYGGLPGLQFDEAVAELTVELEEKLS